MDIVLLWSETSIVTKLLLWSLYR